MIRMSVATVTTSLAVKMSLCTVIVYNHCLGQCKWHYNLSIKPAPDVYVCAFGLEFGGNLFTLGWGGGVRGMGVSGIYHLYKYSDYRV